MLDPSVFMAAFEAAGLTVSAEVTTRTGVFTAPVGFTRPDQDAFGGVVSVPDYQIEFETSAIPGIRKGDSVVIDGLSYAVTEHRLKGDGFFSSADLKKS